MTPEIDYNIFRNNLKKLRVLNEMTARELAVKANLRQIKRVSDIEEGRGKPTLEEVFSICDVLNQSIDGMLKSEALITVQYK